jgi:hypothetical protein
MSAAEKTDLELEQEQHELELDILSEWEWHKEQCVLSNINSRNAKKPRPKKHATRRSETIAAMRYWRADEKTLPQFLAAAATGSIDKVTIIPDDKKGYSVDCDSVFDPNGHRSKPKSESNRMLQSWWVVAGRSSPT